jgi:hypothetical protein
METEKSPDESGEKKDEGSKLIRKHMLADRTDKSSFRQKCRYLLYHLQAWDECDPDVKTAIEPKILDFMEGDPLPEDKEIAEKIEREKSLADGRISLERKMGQEGHHDIPEEIMSALKKDIISILDDNPELTPGEVCTLADDYMNTAREFLKKAHEENIAEIPGIRSIIALDVIRTMRRFTETAMNNGAISHIRSLRPRDGRENLATIPGTPLALKGKNG